MTSDHSTGRNRLFPRGVEQVQLYHDLDRLQSAVDECGQIGWEALEFNSGEWSDNDRMHNDLSATLTLPSYYGRNLDALHDVMQELGRIGTCFGSDATGGLLVLKQFDRFVAVNRSRAEAVLDIFASATSRSLQYGWPLAVFVQTDDPTLRLQPVAPIPVDWNPGERRR